MGMFNPNTSLISPSKWREEVAILFRQSLTRSLSSNLVLAMVVPTVLSLIV